MHWIFRRRIFRCRVIRCWIFQYRAIQFRRLRLFVNGVLDSGHFAFLVASLPPCDISGFFKLPNGGTDSVDTFPVDVGQPCKGIVPILRQGQHEGQQPLRFQRQRRVPQMMVCHHRVVTGFLNAKYRHNLTSLRRSGKVFVFGKNSILCPFTFPCGKTYGHLICISYMKKYLRFLTPFNTVFRVLDGK